MKQITRNRGPNMRKTNHSIFLMQERWLFCVKSVNTP
jgi:hypothetical protein